MQGDIVGYLVYIVVACSLLNVAGDVPCSVDREIGVMTDNVHAEVTHGVCDHAADSAETDDTECLAFDLSPCELALAFFYGFADFFSAFERLCPLVAFRNVSCSQQHSGQAQFFYCVGVSSRSIEYYDALFCAFVERDIVHACAGSADSEKFVRKLHFMHAVASEDDAVSFLDLFCDRVVIGKTVETYR